MKIKHWPWLFKYFLKGYNAITIYPFVIFKDFKPDPVTINHERIHVEQVQRDGFFKFYISYGWQYLRGRIKGKSHFRAYHDISYEKEAYQNQQNFSYRVQK